MLKIEGFTASPQQTHAWRLARDGHVFNAVSVSLLRGDVKPEAIKRALHEMPWRHEILRTGFVVPPGRNAPIQVINETSSTRFEARETERGVVIESLAADLLAEGRAVVFDPNGADRLWAVLAKLDPGRALLALAAPSFCSDSVGLDNLLQDLGRALDGGHGDREQQAETLQYVQFSEWLTELERQEEDGLVFWDERRLESAAMPLLSGAAGEGGRFRAATLSLPAHRLGEALAGAPGDPEDFLLACYAALLSRLTGQEKVTVAVAYSGRSFDELKSVSGPFAAFAPLAIRVGSGAPFEDVLARTAAIRQDAESWQNCYGLGHSPPAPMTYGFQYAEGAVGFETEKVVLQPLAEYWQANPFAIQLCVRRGAGGAWLTELYYDVASLDERLAAAFGECFLALADDAWRDSTKSVSALSLLSEPERRRLLETYNQTQDPLDFQGLLPQLFETRAAAHPDRIAVVFEDERLSYGQLNRRANRVARHLIDLGVGPDEVVALCLERSLDSIVMTLGVLKAGGAYLPIAPDLPRKPFIDLIEDSNALALIADEPRAFVDILVATVYLDADWLPFDDCDDADPDPLADPEHGAYLIYTSGSTGKPKGVMVEHRNLLNYLHGLGSVLGSFTPTSYASVSTLSADLGNTAIFPALANGDALHVISPKRISSADAFGAYFETRPVDCLKITPSHLTALMDQIRPARVLPRTCLFLGGEAARPELVRAINGLAPNLRIFNHYGPTETTIGVATYLYDPAAPDRFPIGAPIANTRFYLLDGHGGLLPEGLPGELYIAGESVARGYLNQPELTRERFLSEPFGSKPGRMYRTGDLVRRLSDGNLEFLGRLDRQVKIRGYRVELGQIEHALAGCDAVREAAVVAWDDGSGVNQLVAYLAPDEVGAAADTVIEAARRSLTELLPEYMSPALLTVLEKLPLNANGKLDRKALPDPASWMRDRKEPMAKPEGSSEEKIWEIWSDYLHRDEISVNDNFFELGGHSLNGTIILSHVNEAFSEELPLATLFKAPSIRMLADEIHRRKIEKTGYGAVLAQAGLTVEEMGPMNRLSSQDLYRLASPLLAVGGSQETIPDLPRKPGLNYFPVSFAQQRLWFLDHLVAENVSYNIPAALRLQGTLSLAALEWAISSITKRHESLRTTFERRDDQPAQVVHPPRGRTLPVVDYSRITASRRESLVRRFLLDEMTRPFDLQKGPLLRVCLLRLADDDFVLMATLHHIISDFWSVGVMIGEISELYASFLENRSPRLAALPVQYPDFAKWQRDWLAEGTLDRQLAYWVEKLGDAPSLLELPTDRPRPPVQTFRGNTKFFRLDPDATIGLAALGEAQGATMFMTMLAAYKALLFRFSGARDIVVGVPVANRGRKQLESLIGFFVNALAMRDDLSDDPSFRQLLGRVRQTALEAFSHQDAPFERVVERLQPERILSHQPVFQVVFDFRNPSTQKLSLPGLSMKMIGADVITAKFDLILLVMGQASAMDASFEYNTDLFDDETIGRLIEYFHCLLTGIAGQPDLPISRLPMTPAAERRCLLETWNDTVAPYSRESTLHDMFETRARRQPSAVALIHGRAGDPDERQVETVAYLELNRRANRLAHYLRERGIGRGDLVGVAFERGPDMAIALLGVLKAGAAYVPMEATFPETRITTILDDIQAPLWLTQTAVAERFPNAPAEAVCLDALAFESQPDHDPEIGATSTDLAYIIFTSGSTGRPKGVILQHRPVANLIEWVNTTYRVGPDDRLLFITSLCFDLSVYDVFGILAAGGQIYIAADQGDPQALAWILNNRRITFWDSAPAALQQLVPFLPEPGQGSPDLRLVFLSGDWIPLPIKAALTRVFPNVRVVGLGGATEAAIWSNFHNIEDIPEHWLSIPYGAPIQNARYYVLDQHLEPCPIGVPGALHIGGECLSLGYHNQPGLTAARFLPDPHNPLAGGVLYATGDQARWRVGGHLEFLGRLDHQVKVRGYRIELGEIEHALEAHESVRDAAVAVLGGKTENKRLAAILTAAGEKPSITSLRAHVERALPAYMAPHKFVFVERLPTTPNGKLDRTALMALAQGETAPAAVYVAPRTPAEKVLCQIWASLLGRREIGIHDNFFEAGGDSIMAIQVVSRARKAGLNLAPRQLFQHQTVALLAAQAQAAAAARQSEMGPLSGAVPLTPIQRWFFEQPGPYHHFNQSLLFVVPADVNATALAGALQRLVRHHDALRLQFLQDGDDWRQAYAEPEDAAEILRIQDLAGLPEAAQTDEMEKRAQAMQAGFDLGQPPLLRAALFIFSPTKPGRLLLTIHHLAVDGVSWRILLEDLRAAYDALCEDRPISFPAKTASYRDWALHLEAMAQAPQVVAELEIWRDLLSRPGLMDFPEPAGAIGPATVADTRKETVRLNEVETRALLEVPTGERRADIDETLLCAIARAFEAWNRAEGRGGGDLLLAVEGHGREDAVSGAKSAGAPGETLDLTATAGWLTNIYPVRITPGGDPSEAIARVKEQVRSLPGKGLGFSLLRYLNPETASVLAELPQPQIVFNYLGRLRAEKGMWRIADEPHGAVQDPARVRPFPIEISGATLDDRLSLSIAYAGAAFPTASIRALADSLLQSLRELASHFRRLGRGPSDFPLAALDNTQWRRLKQTWPDLEDVFPLTQLQQGILFHSLYDRESSAYFVQLKLRLDGQLEPDALRGAWQYALDRHAALRVAMALAFDPVPMQVVCCDVALPWTQLDWSDRGPADQAADLEAFLAQDMAQGFDLAKPPLLRVALIRLAPQRHFLIFSSHHVLMDGWSLSALSGEVLASYRDLVEDRSPTLEPAPRYRDYIAWLSRHDHAEAESFWREYLVGFEAATPLPGESARAGEGVGERIRFLSDERTQRLEDFARSRRFTLNLLCQGAWALLLSRCSGKLDVVFGAVVSGRPADLAGVESMIGLFINTLPVRLCVDERAAALDHLLALRDHQIAREPFQYAPLHEIKRWSPVTGELFESLFVFENFPVDATVDREGASLPFRIAEVKAVVRTHYPLSLTASPGNRLRLKWVWDAARFDEAAILRLEGLYLRLLESLTAMPERCLFDLPFLEEGERRRLVHEFNETAADYPADRSVPELFEARAVKQPERPALIFGEQAVSFGELEARANQLARRLVELGVGPDAIIGVALERGPDLILALLATLKAGGAYLHLDIDYPAERLRFMADDAACPLLITTSDLAARLFPGDACLGTRRLPLDEEAAAIERRSPASFGHAERRGPVDSNSPAYAVYTSGSTGKPKGVLGLHRGVVNRCHWMWRTFPFEDGDVMCQKSSLSFVGSLWELFGSLLAGVPMVLASAEQAKDPERLARLVEEWGVTWLKAAPSLLETMLDTVEPERLQGCRSWIVSGEALRGSLARRFFDLLPKARLINTYGSSEDSAESCAALISRDEDRVSIGRPIANMQAYVLDRRLQPAPTGMAGDLFIGGLGLARGYLNQAALTAERFIPNPFSEASGARLYRTGDLACWRTDGQLGFIGRADHQVKVRGFRVELGEVEAVCAALSAVSKVAVIAREHVSKGVELVAHLVAREGCGLTSAGLRERLAQTLPDYLIPSVFVIRAALPVNANGKVDRLALQAERATGAAASGERLAPQTIEQELLCGLWSEALGLDAPVGIDDDFFELGGHSLTATRLAASIRRVFDIDLPIREIFAASTVETLAARLPDLARDVAAPAPRRSDDRPEWSPLSFAQQRLWFLDRLQGGAPTYNMPAAIRLEGGLQVDALEQAFDAIQRRHESLRTHFGESDGGAVQIIAPHRRFSLPLIDLGRLDPEMARREADQLIAADASELFPLDRGPLFRACVIRFDARDHALLVNKHHIISDAWSVGVLIRELRAFYGQTANATDDAPTAPPPLPIQYADYAIWQRNWLQGETLDRQLEYWRRQLAGAPESIELPTIGPRPSVQTFRGNAERFAIGAGRTAALKRLARNTQATLFLALETGFTELLRRYSGSRDLCVGMPVANRRYAELENLIGFFVNTLVLRVDLVAGYSVVERIAAIRERVLSALAHQDLPFEKLVDELNPPRHMGRHPLFQVVFVYQNAPMDDFQLEGIEASFWNREHGVSKFDLNLSMTETPQGLLGRFEYNTDLFSPAMIRRMTAHFVTLLEGMAAHPEMAIDRAPMLTEAERTQLLDRFNDTAVPYRRDICLHELFEAQAARSPEAIAVVFGGQAISYGELSARVDRLAGHLRAASVGRGDLVGMLLRRTPRLIEAMLATIRAGAAYVPMEPDWPFERIAFILAETGCRFTLTQQELGGLLERAPSEPIFLDNQTSADQPKANPDGGAESDDLAYIIFTSGSTGKPKGVALQHRPVVNLIEWVNRTHGVGPADRLLFITSPCFDLSVYDVFGMLAAGGSIYLASDEEVAEPNVLVDLIESQEITFWDSAPAALQQLAPLLPGSGCGAASLRLVFLSGDWIPLSLPPILLDVFPNLQVVGLGGATEAAIWSNFHQVAEVRSEWRSIPYGRPIQNAAYYVLDEHLEPVPVGVSGDLYISGECLSLGYFGQCALTAERYLPNPHGTPGSVLYTTGDRARFMFSEDGNPGPIEFLGRLDHQVKIRGFRIELGEIESVLREQPEVVETVVLAHGESRGDEQLTAFVEITDAGETERERLAAALLTRLQERLPAYMVPATLQFTDAWPQTPNGKLDRQALSVAAGASAGLVPAVAFVAPRGETEERVAAIWRRTLEQEEIGVHHDFFSLGGHSLSAVQVLAQIQKDFQVELSLRGFFEEPTVEKTTERIEAVRLLSQRAYPDSDKQETREDGVI